MTPLKIQYSCTNLFSNNVSVIERTDDGKYRNRENITVGSIPRSITIDDDDEIARATIVYVANSNSNSVSVINRTGGNYTNIANITVGNNPHSITVDNDDNIAYVANYDSNSLYVLYSECAGESLI